MPDMLKPKAAEVLLEIAEALHNQGLIKIPANPEIENHFFLSCKALCEYIISHTSGSYGKADAYYIIGLCSRRSGEYAETAEALAGSYQADPAFIYADYCLFENVRCYSKLAKEGKISRCEAFYFSYPFYDELLNHFPQSKYCSYAQRWLSICADSNQP